MNRRIAYSERLASGFTVTELMAVLAIATILLAIGVASFASLLRNQRMSTTVNEFFAAINLARSEAIQRGRRVDLVPVDGSDWASGWMVLVDEDDAAGASRKRIVLTRGPAPPGIRISATLTDSSRQYLAYDVTGRTRTNSSSMAPQSGTWSFSQDGHVKRRIKIGFLGRPRACRPEADRTCTGTAE